MLKDLTIESVSLIQRGTDMINDIYCHIKFAEISEPIAFWAKKDSTDEFSSAMWIKLDNGDYGEVSFPPTNYSSHPMTEQEKAAEIRAERDDRLLKSDWTQISGELSDSKKAQWATYRTALRDVPNQVSFPFEINWPSKP
jgi:hypothetical protein